MATTTLTATAVKLSLVFAVSTTMFLLPWNLLLKNAVFYVVVYRPLHFFWLRS
jgi:hypothetical protein